MPAVDELRGSRGDRIKLSRFSASNDIMIMMHFYIFLCSCELELNTDRMEAQYQPNTAESQAVVEEGPYTLCEMVIGLSPDLVPVPEPDPKRSSGRGPCKRQALTILMNWSKTLVSIL